MSVFIMNHYFSYIITFIHLYRSQINNDRNRHAILIIYNTLSLRLCELD